MKTRSLGIVHSPLDTVLGKFLLQLTVFFRFRELSLKLAFRHLLRGTELTLGHSHRGFELRRVLLIGLLLQGDVLGISLRLQEVIHGVGLLGGLGLFIGTEHPRETGDEGASEGG